MGQSLEECLFELAQIERENGTNPSLLKLVYERVTDQSDLSILTPFFIRHT